MKTLLYALLSICFCGNLVAAGGDVRAVRVPGVASIRSRRTRREEDDAGGAAQAVATVSVVKKFQAASLEEASRYAHAIAEKLGGDVYRIADTGSMEPTLSKNTLIVILPVGADEIAVGDIVTFTRRGGEAVTHRVTAHAGDGIWRTKGDANKITDVAPMKYSQVLGRVAYAIRFPAESASPAAR